jgi:hypothetical protein
MHRIMLGSFFLFFLLLQHGNLILCKPTTPAPLKTVNLHPIFRILVMPKGKTYAALNENKVYRTLAYFENNTVHMKHNELIYLIQSKDNGYGKMVDTITYKTMQNENVVIDAINGDYRAQYSNMIANYVSQKSLNIKLHVKLKPFPRMPVLNVYEPKDNSIVYCQNELNCTLALPFNISIHNFIVGVNGSLCITVEHFGILKRQCIQNNLFIHNNMHQINEDDVEIDVAGTTHYSDKKKTKNEVLKINLSGSGMYTHTHIYIYNPKDNIDFI